MTVEVVAASSRVSCRHMPAEPSRLLVRHKLSQQTALLELLTVSYGPHPCNTRNLLRHSQPPDPNQSVVRLNSVVFSTSAGAEGQDNPDKKNQGSLSGSWTQATPRGSSLDFTAHHYSTPGYSVQHFPFSPTCTRTTQTGARPIWDR